MRNMEDRMAVPLCIYAVTVIWCWLMPSRVSIDTVESVINIFPTKALALATAALAIVHAALALRGRLVMSVAGLWAVEWFDVWRHGIPSLSYLLELYLPWLVAVGAVG